MGKKLEARKGYTLFLWGENALKFWGGILVGWSFKDQTGNLFALNINHKPGEKDNILIAQTLM